MRGQRAGRSWVIVIGAVAVVVGSAPLAHAQSPLDQVVDQAGDTVSGVVDGLGDPDPVDKVIDAVGDATGLDTTPIEQVKDKVDSTVDRVVGEAPDPGGGTEPGGGIGDPGGGTEPGGGIGDPGDNGSGSRPGAEGRSESPAASRLGAGAPVRRSAARKGGLEPEFTGDLGSLTPAAAVASERPDRAAEAAEPSPTSVPRVVRDLAFPFILGLAVAMFLGIQSRIDGTDSKLIQAPQETHYLSFQ